MHEPGDIRSGLEQFARTYVLFSDRALVRARCLNRVDHLPGVAQHIGEALGEAYRYAFAAQELREIEP